MREDHIPRRSPFSRNWYVCCSHPHPPSPRALPSPPYVSPHTPNYFPTGPEEHRYALDLDLFDTVNTDDVKQVTTDRTITLVIAKKEEGPHWPRLLKQSGKTPQHVKADWDKWIDEDDEEEAMENGDGGFGGFDPSMLQQFQNMGAMNAMGGGAGAGGFDLSQLSDLAAVDDLEAEEDVEEGDEEEEKE